MTNPTPHGQVPEALTGDKLREIARSARTSASDFASPEEYVLAGWRAAMSKAPSIEDLCARIKSADDAAADNDYMLDSDDCIAVLRGQWKGPMAMDKPERASHGQAPAGATQEPLAVTTGYYGGQATVKALDETLVLPVGIALYTQPAPPAMDASQSAASIAWKALRDLTDPLGEAGTKIMGHVRVFAQRQYEAGRASHGQAPAQTADFTTLGAAMRAIQQAIGLIGDPADERMQAVRRVLRGAVVVAEDSGDIPAQPDCLTCNGHGSVGNILTAEPCPDCTPSPQAAPLEFTKEWCMAAAKAEEESGADISAGVPVSPQAAQQAPAGQAVAPATQPNVLPRGVIRDVFMAHGFTVKEGQTDLKEYVYDAAYALLDAARAAQKEKPHDL